MPIVINELETIEESQSPEDESESQNSDSAATSLLQSQLVEKQWQIIEERQERLKYD